MPTTRPRTSRVRPTYVQPSTRVRHTLGCFSPSAGAGRAGIAVSRRMVTALTRKVAALTYSARSTAAICGTGLSRMPVSSARPAKIAAATGAEPYVVKRLSWLAVSSRSRGTRFGTVASLAGIQIRLATSMRNVATNSHHRVPTSGIDRNSANRARSQTTMVSRRSSRSATTPASGPMTMAGASRRMNTPAMARFAAA